MAVKQVRVSDLSGRQASEEQLAKLIVHEHPQYQGPITLDVLPEELGELPESDQYVSIEVIQPGERSGQRALLSVDSFNKLASSGDMPTILMNAVATQQPQRPAQPRRRGRGRRDGQARGRGQVEWGLPHRGRISPEEAAYVREHLDEVQRLRACRCWIRPIPRRRSVTACNRVATRHQDLTGPDRPLEPLPSSGAPWRASFQSPRPP